MKVTCANCGEELLGAVNTCWRCGRPVAATNSPDEEVVTAELSPRAGEEFPEPQWESEANHAPNADSAKQVATASGAPTDSSPQPPFAGEPAAARIPAPDVRSMEAPTHYARYAAATGGAVGALVLAVMSLVFAYFTIGALFTALLGIGMGAWGVQSNHRKMAIAAMALCCLAVVLSACFGAVHLYTEVNGHLPWESPPAPEPELF